MAVQQISNVPLQALPRQGMQASNARINEAAIAQMFGNLGSGGVPGTGSVAPPDFSGINQMADRMAQRGAENRRMKFEGDQRALDRAQSQKQHEDAMKQQRLLADLNREAERDLTARTALASYFGKIASDAVESGQPELAAQAGQAAQDLLRGLLAPGDALKAARDPSVETLSAAPRSETPKLPAAQAHGAQLGTMLLAAASTKNIAAATDASLQAFTLKMERGLTAMSEAAKTKAGSIAPLMRNFGQELAVEADANPELGGSVTGMKALAEKLLAEDRYAPLVSFIAAAEKGAGSSGEDGMPGMNFPGLVMHYALPQMEAGFKSGQQAVVYLRDPTRKGGVEGLETPELQAIEARLKEAPGKPKMGYGGDMLAGPPAAKNSANIGPAFNTWLYGISSKAGADPLGATLEDQAVEIAREALSKVTYQPGVDTTATLNAALRETLETKAPWVMQVLRNEWTDPSAPYIDYIEKFPKAQRIEATKSWLAGEPRAPMGPQDDMMDSLGMYELGTGGSQTQPVSPTPMTPTVQPMAPAAPVAQPTQGLSPGGTESYPMPPVTDWASRRAGM